MYAISELVRSKSDVRRWWMEIAESNLEDMANASGLRLAIYTLLGSIDNTLDNEITILILPSFRDLESLKCICEFESMCQ
jgi:hypothetical protein